MRPRYFLSYFDDSLSPLNSHRSAVLVNRRPVIMSFLKNRPKRYKGAEGASLRMGKKFLKKLEGLGL